MEKSTESYCPLDRGIARDENGLFTDIEQLRYMTHSLVNAISELVGSKAGDVIAVMEPQLGLEVALMALGIHSGLCTCTKEEKGEQGSWGEMQQELQSAMSILQHRGRARLN